MDWSRRQFLGTGAFLLGQAALDAQETADLILFNGRILTVDDAFSIRQAIVIRDGRIVAVGDNELRRRYRSARVTDLGGRTVMPGFCDTHIHPGGHSRRYIDFSRDEIAHRVAAAAARQGQGAGAGEALSIQDAITMYTRNGAFLAREEKLKGTLEAGKLADMIVLPEDPVSIPPEKLLGLKVDMTIVGGRVLYDRQLEG